jgi:phenylpyruvate tautomerase PptA (4-oxalocrotonate tautomerase family)
MLTIGVELNHVVRNINKQILKYYAKEFDPSMDWEEMDDKCDVFEKYCKFNSKYEKNNFIYIDYPYEIFGCANTAEKKLAVKITNWLSEITNIEDEDIRIIFYSLDEDAITIQSSFFFLSKIGARVRKVIFPKKLDEVWEECDVVITARNQFFEEETPEGKKIVLINREFNAENKDKAFLNYDNLSDVIEDNNFFEKIKG